ncbi:MAG: hypothetical protein AB1752_04100 [Candidatus Zixiibacteriota bacterium]
MAVYLRPMRLPRETPNRSDGAILASYSSDDNSSVIFLGLGGTLSGTLTGPLEVVGNAALGVDFKKTPLIPGSRHNPLRSNLRVGLMGGTAVRLARNSRFLGGAGFALSGDEMVVAASVDFVQAVRF